MQGLQNLGSTCAINSLIQIICRNDHLRQIILNDEIPNGTLSSELKEILDMMHNNNHSLSPRKFVSHLYKHFEGVFQQGEQIDIGELWMFLFDKLATELAHNIVDINTENVNTVINIDTLDNISMASHTGLHLQCQNTMNKFNNNKTSKWLDTSQGIMLSITKCNECNDSHYNFEPFITIPLDIPQEGSVSIAMMFRNYLKAQISCGDWKCSKCAKCTEYTKYLKIWKMPKVLVFIIKRFSNIHTKIRTPISINKTLSVKKGSILADIAQDYKYECSSIGYHFGDLFGGHYCALCKIDDKYILYDDLSINIINEEQTKKAFDKSDDCYMLVYTLNQGGT